MGWTEINKDGTKTEYKISYSQELQQKLVNEMKISNWLKIILLLVFIFGTIIFALIYFNTGIVGAYLRLMVC